MIVGVCVCCADEILHLVLETLTAALKAAPEAAAPWEPHISGGSDVPAVLCFAVLCMLQLCARWAVFSCWRGGGWQWQGGILASGGQAGTVRQAAMLLMLTHCPPPPCPAPSWLPAEPALNAWIANVADPLLSVDARELIEALAAIPACLPSLQVGGRHSWWCAGVFP